MGQGVRFVMGEASTSSSTVWASFEGRAPLDPPLTVMGSRTPPDWGGSGAPPCSWARGASIRLGDDGAVSPADGRAEVLLTPVDGRGSDEPVCVQK